ncbi:hypothetical protein [Allonocardiopsis opalescens]|uniref:DUF8083 domain-containing protein n=1 Tax=Allonocardiopsis opalescens TaxID=1144618 RepID=A0A2T0QAT8_9ACTN|nr:hypothetical protein [Allonocardiopsis opalescens]PRY00922.1 hypothetical protein CLV72_102555 [Allonocardiopsis opalescens]
MRDTPPPCHDAFVLPYTAYFRVYQPLIAYTGADRAHWQQYAASADRPRRVNALAVEHRAALRRLMGRPPVVAPERESGDAYVRRANGQTYVCPWRTRSRSWAAFGRFRAQTEERLVDVFVPRVVVDQLTADQERARLRGEDAVPQILESNWTIPLSWFVPFDSAQRWLVLAKPGPPAAAGADDAVPQGGEAAEGRRAAVGQPVPAATHAPRSLLYVAPMGQARRRLARAVAVIRRHVGDGDLLTEVRDAGRWLEGFHRDSLVELDYGGLVHLLDDETLRTDQSVAEVAAALTGLETRQDEVSMAMYQRLRGRWDAVQARERAN